MSRDGRIGDLPARLWRDDTDRLQLELDGQAFDLAREVVRHRGDAERVTFSVGSFAVEYPRGGPEPQPFDPAEDEGWTWEDADFGLFVFNVATCNGPVKHRHLVAPRRSGQATVDIDAEGVRRTCPGYRTQAARFAELTDVRFKFEVSGIWSDMAVLVLETAGDLATVPFHRVAEVTVPGWDADAVARAMEYGARHPEIGPRGSETIADWCDLRVWPA